MITEICYMVFTLRLSTFLANIMSVQDFKENVSSMLITKVSFYFFFNSVLKSPPNIMVMVLRPSSGRTDYSSENFGANVPK
jgi:hypothetical protein